MEKNTNVSLKKIPKHMHDMYEIGLNFDQVYQINNENEIPIGLIFISDTVDENIYIEWLEFLITFRKKGYLRKVMHKLVEIFNKEIQFECAEDLRICYWHIGCVEHGKNELTGNYQMSYNIR